MTDQVSYAIDIKHLVAFVWERGITSRMTSFETVETFFDNRCP